MRSVLIRVRGVGGEESSAVDGAHGGFHGRGADEMGGFEVVDEGVVG